MVPVSLYLGFASAIIWVEQVHTSLYRISVFVVAKARILFLTLLWVGSSGDISNCCGTQSCQR